MERPISGWATIIFALVVVAAASWQGSRETAHDWSLDYVAGTVRLIERTIEMADAAERAKGSRWKFLRVVAETPEEARRRGIKRYQRAIDRIETEHRTRDAWALRAYLTFLLADAGRSAEAKAQLAIMARFPESCGFCEAMRFVDSRSAGPAPRSLAPLRAGWSATLLEIRLLEAAGQKSEAERMQAAAERSARARLVRMVAVVALAAGLLYVGVISLAFEIRYPAWRPRIDSSPPVAPWRWARGIGVYVRSELVGLILSLLAVWYGCGGPASVVCLWASFFWFLPLLWLVRRYLGIGPWKETCRDFRLLPLGLTTGQVLRTGVGMLSVIWLGATALTAILEWLGGDADLSEIYFDPMVMDTAPRAALASVNAVVWGPLTEELTFRGLVYMSLRVIARPSIAAFGSASLFAAAHLYSVQASSVVFLTGLVLAFGFERYRTLLPALVSHALGNFIFVVSNVVVYR